MARSRWIYVDGVAIPADDHEALAKARGHADGAPRVMPDLPDFVSPIDGKRYSGRAGLREHCAKHNVVPTADLAGLPPKPAYQTPVLTKAQREERKQQIAYAIDSNRR